MLTATEYRTDSGASPRKLTGARGVSDRDSGLTRYEKEASELNVAAGSRGDRGKGAVSQLASYPLSDPSSAGEDSGESLGSSKDCAAPYGAGVSVRSYKTVE